MGCDEREILGSGVERLVGTPISESHVLYLVNGVEQQVLLPGDACNALEQFSTGIGPGTCSSDIAQAQLAMDRIKRFNAQYPQVGLSFGHDEAVLR